MIGKILACSIYRSIFVLFIIFTNITQAQKKNDTYWITGTVVDQLSGKALPKVTVHISSFSEATDLTGTTTDDKGYFTIPNISNRIVRAKFSMVGYQTQIVDSIDLKTTHGIGLIKLLQAPVEMPEVVIKSLKPMIEMHIDKQVINMDRIPGSNGTLTEALRNSGAVEVDPQSNKISVRGQDIKIQLDGHPVDMSQDLLTQMPADLIDQVEVIMSPGAKESAEGGAYILNLISKKSTLDNLNGSASLSTATNNRNSSTLNLNYKENKFNIFGSFTGVLGGNKNKSSIDQINYQSPNLYNQTSDRNYRNDFYMLTGKLGLDYNFDENDFFTFYGFYSYYNGTSESRNDNSIRDNQGRMQYSFVNKGNSDFSGYNTSVTGFYKRKLEGKGHELTLDLYYMRLGIPADNYMNVLYSYKPSYPELQNSGTDLRSNTFVLRLNYIVPAFSGSAETGYNFTTRNRENDYNSLNYSYLQNNWQDSMKLSNLFKYRENIHALYITYSTSLGKFELKTGLRAEDLLTDGQQMITNNNFSGSFLNLFPNLNIAYKFNSIWQLAFNAFRRVTYPQLDYVNPFRIYNGPNNYSEGNPLLEPSFISSYGLSLSQYLSVYYVHSTGIVSNVTTVSDDSISFNKYINLNSGKTYGLDLTLPYYNSPSAFITLPDFITMCNLQFSYRYYRQFGEFINENLTYIEKTWNLRGQLSLKLWYDVNAMLSFYYRPGSENERVRSQDFRYMAISFSKSFLDQKLKVGLAINDLFNTVRVGNENFGSNYYIRSYSKTPNSRAVSISVTYMFNNFKERNDRKVDDGRDMSGNSGL